MQFPELWPGPAPQLPQRTFERRRDAIAAALGDDEILFVATNPERIRSNDVHHPYRPHSDFWYLTGLQEPSAVLALQGGTGHSTLFLRPRRPEQEIWTGRRLGPRRAPELLGVDEAYPIAELAERLTDIAGESRIRTIVAHDVETSEILDNHAGSSDGRALLAEARLRKDDDEIGLLRKASEVSMEAHRRALALAGPGRKEYEVEAELLRSFRAAGSTGPGYPPIVGAGPNGAILHYIDNTATITDPDLVLVDAGCEWGWYSADITRTVPAAGEWDETPLKVYELVHRAQQAAIATVRPGATIKDVHDAAAEVLAAGLVDAGWLDGSVESVLRDDSIRRFYMHGTSHFLGLDVHDAGGYKDADGNSRRLEPGMVITVEPGLYFNPDYTDCPSDVRGLGIRIENDLVVTHDGHEDLDAGLATDPDGVLELVGG